MSDSSGADERHIAMLYAAMKTMHTTLQDTLEKLQVVVDDAHAASEAIDQVSTTLVPAVTQAATRAIDASLRSAIAEIADPARRALDQSVQPVMARFAQLGEEAARMEHSARRTAQWVTKRWLAVIAAGFGGMLLVAWMAVWWQRHEVGELVAQKVALEADLAQLQANVDALEKKGGRIKLEDCGGRVCLVASSNQGKGTVSWKGFWTKKETGQALVIPQGY